MGSIVHWFCLPKKLLEVLTTFHRFGSASRLVSQSSSCEEKEDKNGLKAPDKMLLRVEVCVWIWFPESSGSYALPPVGSKLCGNLKRMKRKSSSF